MNGYYMSHDAAVDFIETTDVGGTTAETGWKEMGGKFNSAYAKIVLGTWNAGDDLDHCRIEAASDSSGNNNEEVTTDASGGNYDTDSPIDADGDSVIIEIKAEDLPVGKPYINLIVGEDGNTGTDNVTAVLIRYNAVDKTAEKDGAAAAGSKVYVTPNT